MDTTRRVVCAYYFQVYLFTRLEQVFNEEDIQVEYESHMAYYMIEQIQDEYKARQFARRDTIDWLKENGYSMANATRMTLKAIKRLVEQK